ncbi:hypothetical protein [Candidatus Hodarchaeum mangrovi]
MFLRGLSARTILGVGGIFILFIWVVPLQLWPLNLWLGSIERIEFDTNRYSNHTEGITPILYLEGLTVLEKAREIDSEENEYINLSYQGYGLNHNYKVYNVIDNTTIDYYATRDEGKGMYLAYSWSIVSQNFSETVISAILEDLQLVDQYLYNRLDRYLYDDWRLDYWITNQNITDIHLLSGWFIFQRLEYGIIRGPLDGDGLHLTQISIIDSNMNLLWIASSIAFWIA